MSTFISCISCIFRYWNIWIVWNHSFTVLSDISYMDVHVALSVFIRQFYYVVFDFPSSNSVLLSVSTLL